MSVGCVGWRRILSTSIIVRTNSFLWSFLFMQMWNGGWCASSFSTLEEELNSSWVYFRRFLFAYWWESLFTSNESQHSRNDESSWQFSLCGLKRPHAMQTGLNGDVNLWPLMFWSSGFCEKFIGSQLLSRCSQQCRKWSCMTSRNSFLLYIRLLFAAFTVARMELKWKSHPPIVVHRWTQPILWRLPSTPLKSMTCKYFE